MISRPHIAINRQLGRDAPSNPIRCVSIHQSTMVSHVMLILSETNPIICAVSESILKDIAVGFVWGFALSIPGAPCLSYLLTQGRKWGGWGDQVLSGLAELTGRCQFRREKQVC